MDKVLHPGGNWIRNTFRSNITVLFWSLTWFSLIHSCTFNKIYLNRIFMGLKSTLLGAVLTLLPVAIGSPPVKVALRTSWPSPPLAENLL